MNLLYRYRSIKSYLSNTLWLMGDNIITLGVGFLTSVVIARYLGPEEFGVFSYAISMVALFAAAGHMGLSGLVVREVVKKPGERGIILGTTLGLKFIGMISGYVILLTYAAIYEGFKSREFAVLALAGIILIFRPFDIIDFWFQAFVQARYATVAKLTGLAVGAFCKLLFVFLGFNVFYFIGASVIQAAFVTFSLLIVYKLKSSLSLSEWGFSWKKAKELFSDGWVIYLGSIFAVIYLKIDQVMLRWFEGTEAVGIYAVASQLSEAWYFIPGAIVASLFPKLIKLREVNICEFNKRMQQLFDLLFILALIVAIIMTFLSEWIITIFFGQHYIESSSVLVIHIWAAIFIFMRSAFSKWILIENALVFSLITQGTGALINVALNFIFIPRYGVQGAAYATLASYACASFFSLLFYSKTRPVFFMMFKSVFSVFRYANLKALK